MWSYVGIPKNLGAQQPWVEERVWSLETRPFLSHVGYRAEFGGSIVKLYLHT